MKLKNFMKRILILKTLHTRYRKFKVKNKIKVLITGGAGFVGAHLTYKLISLGHKVLVVDILKSQGGIPFVNKNCNFIKGDISKLSTIKLSFDSKSLSFSIFDISSFELFKSKLIL